MNKVLRDQVCILFLGCFFIIMVYQFVDRPIVAWAHAHKLRQYKILDYFTRISDVLDWLVFLLYPVLALRFCFKKITYHDRAALAFCNSTVITIFIKDRLKSIFGRYWPGTWTHSNLSWIRDGVYGFNWFKSGDAYESFPSGHTAVTVACMTVVYIQYPKLRWLSVLLISLMVVGQVGLYYHFLSDVMAGGLLGYLIAAMVCYFFVDKESCRVAS